VEPGEVVAVTEGGLSSHHPFPAREVRPAHCLFEHVYFSRPDSVVFGESVQEKRIRVGRRLAIEHPVAADLVIPIPDSGVFAALGYSQESGIPYGIGVIRNHYVGRTFIQPVQGVRDLKVRIKFNPVREVVAGKRLVVVDDSIVRGTTLRARVKSLRDAGAREIHLRISCPPTRFSCFYGIDFPTRGELIANTMSLEEIRRYLGADTLGYVSLEGLQGAESRPGDYCTACWSGSYPVPYGEEGDKFAIEKHAGEAGGS
jgi:amidophosphoribosyltransferase